jgi:hypothetical protein
MEKTMRTNIAMSADTTLSAQPVVELGLVMALRSQVSPSVSPDILTKIQNLRGILDARTFSSARNGGDWRRGAGSTGSLHSMDSRWKGSKQNLRASASTGSLSNQSPTTPNTPRAVYTGPPIGRYQSRFRNSSEGIEEKILNRIIRLKLNKFGPTTYDDIRDFLFQILGQESVNTEDGKIQTEEGQVAEFVKDFMLMVFKKAASEQIYCPLYAKLLSEIGSKHSVIFDEMNRLYENYMEIFEEADVNVQAGDMNSFEKKVAEKKYRQGYSQFIAELTTLEILSVDALAHTFHKLFSQIEKHSRIEDRKPLVEEYVDCLLRMSKVMKDKYSIFFRSMRSRIYEENKEILSTLISLRDGTYTSLTSKSRFLLMDVEDILKI